MLQGPQTTSSRTRKKPAPSRTRAQTEFKQQPNTRTRARTDYERQPVTQVPQQATDDLLDLFGSFATTNTQINNSNKDSHNNSMSNGHNAFDPFDFSSFDSNTQTSATTSASTTNGKTKKKKKKKIKKSKNANNEADDDDDADNDIHDNDDDQAIGPPPARARAQTVQTKSRNKLKSKRSPSASPSSSPSPAPASNNGVKMKKIDVLPLLHKGVRANKFKLNGNKSKVRTFYLTETNFYFCWEAVGSQNEKKGLFGKNKNNNTRAKVDKDRSIPIRNIRSIHKNPDYMMQSYKFIPPQQKSLTLTIVYATNGTDKKLNFMSYEPFHHRLFYDGMTQLLQAARDPKRNLAEVFELYVDFPKDILPKHLRPQRFKWEPLGDSDFNNNNNNNNNSSDNNDNNNNNNNNNNASSTHLDFYDPTQAPYGRDRVKSF